MVEQRPTGRTYNFKFWQELCWGMLVAMIVTIAQAFLQFDASAVVDWHVWILSLVSGCARAVSVIVIKSLADQIVFSKE